jgi:proline iminopeptidase
MKLVLALFACFMSLPGWVKAEQKINGLYVNTFGDPKKPALIFIHGGPGYNSQDFEWSTAEVLAAKGYFVVVYDERGQGRSDHFQDLKDYTYQRYAQDLHDLIEHLHLSHPVLLAHSHGGPIAINFDQYFPGVAGKIVLISAPVDFWASIESLFANCGNRFIEQNALEKLGQLRAAFYLFRFPANNDDEIKALDELFTLGGGCGIYQATTPTDESKRIRERVWAKEVPIPEDNWKSPMPAFVINDRYQFLDQSEWVLAHASYIFGIYGDQDGLFTPELLEEIGRLLAANPHPQRMQILKNASHAVYLDQQQEFLDALEKIL